MARDLDDPWTIARATNAYNYVALWKNPAQARADLARGVEMARSIGDWFAVADGLKMATIAWQVEDDHDGGAADCEELLGRGEAAGQQVLRGLVPQRPGSWRPPARRGGPGPRRM